MKPPNDSDQPPSLRPPTSLALMNIFIGVLYAVTLTQQIFLRRKTGLRQLTYIRLFGLTALMLVFAWVFSYGTLLPTQSMHFARWPLVLYALGFLASGLWQHHERWNELRDGVRWHTRSRGISRLKPFFEGFVQEHHLVRFVDPAFCFLISCAVILVSLPLGLWLLVSSMLFFAVEQLLWDRDLNQLLDMLDNIIDAETQSDTLKDFRGSGFNKASVTSIEASGGVLSTGAIMPDLIEKRRQRAAKEGRPIPSDDMLGTSGEAVL